MWILNSCEQMLVNISDIICEHDGKFFSSFLTFMCNLSTYKSGTYTGTHIYNLVNTINGSLSV